MRENINSGKFVIRDVINAFKRILTMDELKDNYFDVPIQFIINTINNAIKNDSKCMHPDVFEKKRMILK